MGTNPVPKTQYFIHIYFSMVWTIRNIVLYPQGPLI